MFKTRCPHCKKGRLKYKGPLGTVGIVSWKCRSCGRRVYERSEVKPPEPVVPMSFDIGG
jgi:transposase-like protein